ncbi:MAG: M23 family metallopeptidase [Flavobacteriaceae bacterium]|nr:M23 family metallopeptidase [Flavobacteriaceae bacterium]
MKIPMLLSGTFGELRSNHFHAGIDIKTLGREGVQVYAIGDGYVSRIKVSLWGYGKVVYVKHPNGYTSVYGHLRNFAPKLEAYVKKMQYEKQSYEIHLFPKKNEFQLKKGELLAWSGNTGSSGGPHLHFEIRDTPTEHPMNPLLFGYDIQDKQPPMLREAFVYPLSANSIVNYSSVRSSLKLHKRKNGDYISDQVYAKGVIGFGLYTHDRQDLSYNKNGVYEVKVKQNGTLKFHYRFDEFSFDESRYINTFIDYPYFSKHRLRVQKNFKSKNNPLSIYAYNKGNGFFEIEEGKQYLFGIEIKDFVGNTTKLQIPVQGKTLPLKVQKKLRKTDFFVAANKPMQFNLENVKVYFPANTFYENFYADMVAQKDSIQLHDRNVGVHKAFTLSFDISDREDKEKLFIGKRYKDKVSYVGSSYRNGELYAKAKELGTFFVSKDTVSPVVKPRNFDPRKSLKNYKYLEFEIADDQSGIATYNGYLNGRWILLEYEPKRKRLRYLTEDLKLSSKTADLEVIIEDNVGNKTVYKHKLKF